MSDPLTLAEMERTAVTLQGHAESHLDPFWSVELQCTPAQTSSSSSSSGNSSAALRGRPFLHFVLLVGEAMCRSCLEPDAGTGGTAGSSSLSHYLMTLFSSVHAAAAAACSPDAGNGAEIVHASQLQQHQQRAEPLPSEIWLHILSFLRVSELGFRPEQDKSFLSFMYLS
eukprot:gene1923-57_t